MLGRFRLGRLGVRRRYGLGAGDAVVGAAGWSSCGAGFSSVPVGAGAEEGEAEGRTADDTGALDSVVAVVGSTMLGSGRLVGTVEGIATGTARGETVGRMICVCVTTLVTVEGVAAWDSSLPPNEGGNRDIHTAAEATITAMAMMATYAAYLPGSD